LAFFNGIFGQKIQQNKKDDKSDAVVDQRTYGSGAMTMDGFYSGRKVLTEADILSIPAAAASIEIITNAISDLPVQLLENVDTKQGKEAVDSDYRVDMINDSPNNILTGADFKKRMVKDVILYGSSKNYVKYNPDGTINGIFPLDMEKLTTTVYSNNGYEFYAIDTLMTNTGTTDFYDELLLTILKNTNDGIIGRGVIENNADIFTLALRQAEYESNLIGNGAMPTGILTSDQRVNSEKITNSIKDAFKKMYSGSKNVGKTLFLPADLKYQPVSLSPDKLELTTGKKSVISDISRIFNIPESMINSAANKYDSTEQNNLWFLTYTLAPLLTSIETALNKNLLTNEERNQGMEFKFDTSSISRITPTEKQANVISAFSQGIITNITAKREINEKIMPGETEYYKQTTGSVMYIPEKNIIVNPNTGQIMNIDSGEIINSGFDSTPDDNTPANGLEDVATKLDTGKQDNNNEDWN